MEAKDILRSSYLDLLFDRRNKAYGGYELRLKYTKRMQIALLAVVTGALLLTAVPVLADHLAPEDGISIAGTITARLDHDLLPPPALRRTMPTPPPARPAAPPPPARTFANPVPIIAPNDDVTRETEVPRDADRIPGPANNDGRAEGTGFQPDGVEGGTGTKPGATTGPATGGEVPTDAEPLLHLDRMAAFDGDLNGFLSRHLVYPEAERDAGNEGKVIVQFIVERDGSLSTFTIRRSSGFPALDAEALRVVRRMPAWKPGYDKNLPVRSYFRIPILFRLS